MLEQFVAREPLVLGPSLFISLRPRQQVHAPLLQILSPLRIFQQVIYLWKYSEEPLLSRFNGALMETQFQAEQAKIL